MPGSHLFKGVSSAINIGSTRGRGGSTRILKHCSQNSSNPSSCINQFITIGQPGGAVSNISTIRDSTNNNSGNHESTFPGGNVQTIPSKPFITSITSGMNQVTVNFNQPYDGGSSIIGYQYRISSYNDTTPMVNDLPSNRVIVITGSIDISYNIQIRAINSIGNSEWSDTVVGIPTNYGAMGDGFNYDVRSIVLYEDYVFVGGKFTQNYSETVTYNRLAKWSTTNNTWISLGVTNDNANGDIVNSIVQIGDSTSFYVGGNMYKFNSIDLNGIGIFDASSGTWSSIGDSENGSGVYRYNSSNQTYSTGYVYSVAYNSKYNVIYFGGMFDEDSAGNVLNNIASSTPSMKNVDIIKDTNFDKGLNNQVFCITCDNNSQSEHYGNIYVGGEFTSTGSSGSTALNYVAYYNPSTNEWMNMSGGVNGVVLAIAIDPNDSNKIYVGGNFTSAGGVQGVPVKNIACYNMGTSEWSGLNGGPSENSVVRTIAFDSNGNMYVGGSFTSIDISDTTGYSNISVNSIAKWNSSTGWSKLDVQPNQGASIYAIAIKPITEIETIIDIMYIGGSMSSVNSLTANCIYQYQP